jgi:competence protein ComEA
MERLSADAQEKRFYSARRKTRGVGNFLHAAAQDSCTKERRAALLATWRTARLPDIPRARAAFRDSPLPMNTIRRFFLAFLLALALPTLATAQVDINSADAKTLAESLHGIGLVKAEAIVAYRKANGPFKDIDDLAKVKGIGKKTIDANRATIVIVDQHANAQSTGHPDAVPMTRRRGANDQHA